MSAPAAMSGSAASLGLRSGSYGSLAAAVTGSGGAGRKAAAARGWACRGEKERLQLLHRTLRLVGRRRAGVLLLLAVASAAVFCSLFAVVKGEDLCSRLLALLLHEGNGRDLDSFCTLFGSCVLRFRSLN